MKILSFKLVDDLPSATRAVFSFSHAGIEYHGWKVLQSKSSENAFWVAVPRQKLFWGGGAAPTMQITVRLPDELQKELDDMALTEYARQTGSG
ncbi:MAG: hypothetical protein KKH04_19120 [Proteobacteria bacterium]|nr:hypothetical protein [Pseudomonadota bacterium]